MPDYKLNIHDPDKNFVVRICIPAYLLAAAGADPAEGSVLKECDECGIPVWFDPNQVAPIPEDMVVDGTHNLCVECFRFHASIDAEPAVWLGPKPPGFD